jgi:hypothetical protein
MGLRFHIEDMRIIAQQLGGKCLSRVYINNYTALEWMCEKGHRWAADYRIIQQGGWCMQCARNSDKAERMKEMQQTAKDKGGKCLSAEYKGMHTKLKWECREGHLWSAMPYALKQGSWCPKCGIVSRAKKRRNSISVLISFAKKRKGKLLTKNYINTNTPMKWQCDKGHVWMASAHNVTGNKSWCPVCAKRVVPTIDTMHKLARVRNGTCLSKVYVNAWTKLTWGCDQGHIWAAKPREINGGAWCPFCAGKAKHTIEEMRKVAAQRKGKCLSAQYINNRTELKWQCHRKHIFISTPHSILSGTWCAPCYYQHRQETIEFRKTYAVMNLPPVRSRSTQ